MPWGRPQSGGAAAAEAELAAEAEPEEKPCDHVIIGDLPEDFTEDQLREIFGAYTTIKWCRVSKGKGAKAGTSSALVELDAADEATLFIEACHEQIPLGLSEPVTVKYRPEPTWNKANKGQHQSSSAQERSKPYGMPAGGAAAKGVFASCLGMVGNGAAGKGAGKGAGNGAAASWGRGGAGITGGTGAADLFKSLVASSILPGGKWQNDENTVFISGLPPDTTDADLLKIFSPFGAIAAGGAYAQRNPDGTAKGTGIVNFLDGAGAGAAVSALNGMITPNGMALKIRLFRPGPRSEVSAICD